MPDNTKKPQKEGRLDKYIDNFIYINIMMAIISDKHVHLQAHYLPHASLGLFPSSRYVLGRCLKRIKDFTKTS